MSISMRKITIIYLLIMYVLAFFGKPWLVELAFATLSIVEILSVV